MAGIEADQLIVLLIINEMKTLKLWKRQTPSWVFSYNNRNTHSLPGFFEWMQFIYLPNKFIGIETNTESIALQAKQHFEHDMEKGKLLQLLIQLDGLI
ncbi:MAG: hypothetical protein QM594_04965 [Niabella sp.]